MWETEIYPLTRVGGVLILTNKDEYFGLQLLPRIPTIVRNRVQFGIIHPNHELVDNARVFGYLCAVLREWIVLTCNLNLHDVKIITIT